jgi:allantoin racemase
MRRILMLNPNTTVSMTDQMVAAARTYVSPDTEIVGMNGHRGVPFVASRAEAVIAAEVVLERLAELSEPVDAAVIAAFGDPGLGAAREMMDFPVVGLAEASMLTACMLGRRFSIITFNQSLGPWYRECVELHRMTDRLASIRIARGGFASVNSIREEKEDELLLLAQAAIEEDGADVLLFGGGPLAGLAGKLRQKIAVPVVEGVAAAVLQAETLARLNVRRPIAGSYRRPPAKSSIGLPPALERLIGSRSDG